MMSYNGSLFFSAKFPVILYFLSFTPAIYKEKKKKKEVWAYLEGEGKFQTRLSHIAVLSNQTVIKLNSLIYKSQ